MFCLSCKPSKFAGLVKESDSGENQKLVAKLVVPVSTLPSKTA
jgi:hypothetical protein